MTMTNLQEAFREAARREFDMVPAESELDFTFSPKFQRRMQRIIRAQAHGYWQFVNTTAKRVACVAAIILMLLTTAMAIKPIRERVIKFFVEVYEEYFEITFGEEESGDLYPSLEPMTRYTFSWVPDSYYEAEVVVSDAFLSTTWKTEHGTSISLTQGTGTQDITLDHTDNDLSIFEHRNFLISHTSHAKVDELIWEMDRYIFHLTVPKEVSMQDILQMLDSLQPVEN